MEEPTCPPAGHGLKVKIYHTTDCKGALPNYVAVTGPGRRKCHHILRKKEEQKAILVIMGIHVTCLHMSSICSQKTIRVSVSDQQSLRSGIQGDFYFSHIAHL